MILKENYSLEHINQLQKETLASPDIIERTLFAFGLLEAITEAGLSFIFKGGSCLMLLLNQPQRFSTDIDIIVKPGTDIDSYIEKAGKIFPFFHYHEDFRKAVSGIEKRHFKFLYISPIKKTEVMVLLDVLFEENNYSSTVVKPISNSLIFSDSKDVEVTVPGINCILGDKLTAFAPHTTGILTTDEKELEIIKQLFDCATLLREITDFDEVKETYHCIVQCELDYRNLKLSHEEVLMDTIRSGAAIVGRGSLYKTPDFAVYLKGVGGIGNHLFSKKYDMAKAGFDASQVMYLASCVLTDDNFSLIENPENYADRRIENKEFSKLNSIRKISMNDFSYLIECFERVGK